MLLQTNSYIVPKEKRTEHARLLARFRLTLAKLGCDLFECYEQTGANWSSSESSNRFVQIMRFRDRKHQLAVQAAEKTDPTAQALIKEFCELINFPYQQQQGYFAVGFYNSVLPVSNVRVAPNPELPEGTTPAAAAGALAAVAGETLISDIASSEIAEEHPIDTEAAETPALDPETLASEALEGDPALDPPDLAEVTSDDPLQPSGNGEVATADFGDVLDLDDIVIEDEPESTVDKKTLN